VVGLLLLQYFWLISAVSIQKSQYKTEVTEALSQIKLAVLQRASENYGYNPVAIDYDNITIQNILLEQVSQIPAEDIVKIVERNLHKFNIDYPFEFASIKNGFFTNNSKGFKPTLIADSYTHNLNSDGNYIFVLYIDTPSSFLIKRSWVMITVSLILTIIIVYGLILTLNTIFTQKKLSEITTDFMNNMTHEFKTPIATINLAIDVLKNPKAFENRPMFDTYISMIKEENQRMHKLVIKILDSAKTAHSNIDIKRNSVDVQHIIQTCADSARLLLAQKNGTIDLRFGAAHSNVLGDEVHLTNLFSNLLDNAIKYSHQDVPVCVTIITANVEGELRIEVSDNGIGMTKDAVKKVFNRFFRASTGNLHNVKGFGLGLSYVKSIVIAHNGRITASSVLNKGTKFTIYIPLEESVS